MSEENIAGELTDFHPIDPSSRKIVNQKEFHDIKIPSKGEISGAIKDKIFPGLDGICRALKEK